MSNINDADACPFAIAELLEREPAFQYQSARRLAHQRSSTWPLAIKPWRFRRAVVGLAINPRLTGSAPDPIQPAVIRLAFRLIIFSGDVPVIEPVVGRRKYCPRDLVEQNRLRSWKTMPMPSSWAVFSSGICRSVQSSEIDGSGSRLMNARQEIHQGLFPAPFSPTNAWTSPACTVKVHSLQYLDAVKALSDGAHA